MFHNRAPIVCLILLALTTSAFIATRSTTGQAPQANNRPLKMKVLRDKTRVKTSPGPWEIAAFRNTLPQEDERQLEDLIPKHVPIKIKIKKEKEAGFKDLKNERWAREFELEVTNTGTKPIYALDLYVVTDVSAAAGFRIVSLLTYGRNELGDIKTKAEPDDIPIQPGESVSLKFHPNQLNAWDYARKKENRPLPKHLKVEFQFLNFGDGTGFVGTGGTALPRVIPEEEGLAACRSSFQTDPSAWKEAPPGSALSKLLTFSLPARIWLVIFLRGLAFETNTASASLFDTCCPGVNCSMLTQSRDVTCYTCSPQIRVGTAICSNPDASCQNAIFDSFECYSPKFDVEPFTCQSIQLVACGTSPTPSPSSTPTPSPSPTPTPSPCPFALPSECPGGVPRDPCTNPDPPPAPSTTPDPNPDGCPFGYQLSSGACCVPIACPQPTPTPPFCPEGETSLFDGPPICDWSDCFALFPNPTPTPTPTSETVEFKRDCVDYYWVWYVSYDGGKTWQPTGQVDYAGCLYV